MKTLEGLSGAWNYTIGPALIYEGPRSIDQINLRAMPAVVVADYIPLDQLGKIDMHHVYGFVLQGGGYGDPSRIFYSNQHRATVMQCTGILDEVRPEQTVVIDGVDGKVFLDPDPETLQKYEELRTQGPPPEPEGFTDQLIKDAMELATLDPQAMKEGFFDFPKVEKAFGSFMKMYMSEPLTPDELKSMKDMVKGSKVEANVAEKLQVYQEATKAMSDEERAERQQRAMGELGEGAAPPGPGL